MSNVFGQYYGCRKLLFIYRLMFKNNLAKEWEEKFWKLSSDKLKQVQEIVALNKFKDLNLEQFDAEIKNVLVYYKITRDEAELLIKKNIVN